jgi:predicted secreted protein
MSSPNFNQPVNIPNYLVQSILATLFCCLPFGIVAIVFAAQVNSKVQAGDIQGAMQASKQAKMWCWVSVGVSAVCMVLYFGMMIVFGAIAGASR